MNFSESSADIWLKRFIAIASLLLLLPGLPLAFGLLCMTFVLGVEGDAQTVGAGLGSFVLATLTVGAGGVALWHSLHSLQGKASKPLRLMPVWAIAGAFGLCVAMGLFISEYNFATGLFFPPLLLIAAALPPLLAVSWFMGTKANGLTWRRGSLAFVGGATIGVLCAIILEILFPTIILALVFDLANFALANVEQLFESLAGKEIARAVTSPGFIFIFVQIAVIAPLAEELAKPLATLPLIGRLSRRDAFLVGAMAGAGFAALENVIYAGFGFYFWAGILIVRALGGAVHPLGSGMVVLGWWDVLRKEPKAWLNWFTRFGIAVGMHALWNGGSLLVITLAGANFFGELPPEIDILGLSAAGTTLALLVILGLVALWLGRSMAQKIEGSLTISSDEHVKDYFILSDRNAAIWALFCLVAIVPAGIAGLQLLMR